ncbi:MAG: efflux RND transporter periplasmic adaptor subunit [Candidatus Thiodiazotropha endolucinida]
MTDIIEQTPANTSPAKRWIGVAISLIVLALVIFYLLTVEDTIDVEQMSEKSTTPLVTVEKLSVTPQTVKVTAFATVRPRWSAELRAAVSGRIDRVLDSALTGEKVDAGTTLLTIEDSAYVADLASAELAAEEAQLVLSKAQKATTIARREFKRDAKQAPNDLALHLPQLRIAETAVKAANARITAARQKLRDATVKAPFSGFVTERFVSPGQTVNPGDALLKLVDNAIFELTAELGRRDWLLLDQPLAGAVAEIMNQNGKIVAQAKIRRGGGFLDEQTRQYKVFMELNNSGTGALLSGDFVRVVLPGITVPAALTIPESALTQEGYVWYVDDDNHLQRKSPQVLFSHHDRIVIEAPNDSGDWRIAIMPLVSFLPGQQVHPQLAEN